MAGTVNYADLYGMPSGQSQVAAPESVSGPNQGAVAPPSASVGTSGPAGSGAAFTWLAFAILLILLRIFIHWGGEPG